MTTLPRLLTALHCPGNVYKPRLLSSPLEAVKTRSSRPGDAPIQVQNDPSGNPPSDVGVMGRFVTAPAEH